MILSPVIVLTGARFHLCARTWTGQLLTPFEEVASLVLHVAGADSSPCRRCFNAA